MSYSDKRDIIKFLLEREPKEMILRNFDLKIISNYFSEYENSLSEYI